MSEEAKLESIGFLESELENLDTRFTAFSFEEETFFNKDTRFTSFGFEGDVLLKKDTRFTSLGFETLFDTIPPTGTVSTAPYTNSRNIQLELTATDVWSGVKCVEISNNGVDWVRYDWVGDGVYNWTLTAGDGLRRIYVRYRDKEITPKIPDGNVSLVYSVETFLEDQESTGGQMIRLVRDGIKAILGRFKSVEVDTSIKRAGVEVVDENQLHSHVQNDVHVQPQPFQPHTHDHSTLIGIGINSHATIDLHLGDSIANRRHMTDAQNSAFDSAINPSSANRVILADDLDSAYYEREEQWFTNSTSFVDVPLSISFTPKRQGNYSIFFSAELGGSRGNRISFAQVTVVDEIIHCYIVLPDPPQYQTVCGMRVMTLSTTTTIKISIRSNNTDNTAYIRRIRLLIRRI